MPMKGGDMAAKAAGTVLQPLDSGAMLAGFEKMLAPVVADLAEARKALKDQGDLIDQMASAPDPRYAPFKAVAAGGVLPKAMQAEPAAPQQTAVEKAAGNVQATLLRDLQYQARNDPDPGKREVAWQALTEMLHMPGTGAAAR
jgi:hypothetical protein